MSSMELRDLLMEFITQADNHFKSLGYGDNYCQKNPEMVQCVISEYIKRTRQKKPVFKLEIVKG